MKNVNILGAYWKIQLLEGVHKKQCRGRHCLNRGLGKFANLRGVLAIKEGSGAFDGFDTPIHTMGTEPLYKLEPSLSLPPAPHILPKESILKILKNVFFPLFI